MRSTLRCRQCRSSLHVERRPVREGLVIERDGLDTVGAGDGEALGVRRVGKHRHDLCWMLFMCCRPEQCLHVRPAPRDEDGDPALPHRGLSPKPAAKDRLARCPRSLDDLAEFHDALAKLFELAFHPRRVAGSATMIIPAPQLKVPSMSSSLDAALFLQPAEHRRKRQRR